MSVARKKDVVAARRAFSLIELIAVMAILGVVAGIVAYSVRGHTDRARIQATLDLIESIDRQARITAQRLRTPNPIDIDVARAEIQSLDGSGQWRKVQLSPVTIEQVRTRRNSSEQGTLEVVVSANGQSPDYAVCIATASGNRAWLVFLGASGQCIRTQNPNEVQRLIRP